MEPPSPCIKELLHKYKPTRALRSASENNLVIPKTRLSRELTQTAGSKTRITKKCGARLCIPNLTRRPAGSRVECSSRPFA